MTVNSDGNIAVGSVVKLRDPADLADTLWTHAAGPRDDNALLAIELANTLDPNNPPEFDVEYVAPDGKGIYVTIRNGLINDGHPFGVHGTDVELA